MPITHTFVSAKADGGDATLVKPSNWNADHTVTDFGTYFLAAVDATAVEQERCTACGLSVCDGTNDEVDIAAAAALAGVGMLILSSGTFHLDAALTLATGTMIVGQGGGELYGGTNIYIDGTNFGITLSNVAVNNGKMTDLRHVRVSTKTGFADEAVKVLYTTRTDGCDLFDDICVESYHSEIYGATPDQTANSVGFQITSNCNYPFSMNHIGSIQISGFETGFYIKAVNDDSSCYINGNIFESIIVKYSKYHIKLESAGTGGAESLNASVSGNIFQAMQLQPLGEVKAVTALTLLSPNCMGCSWNVFDFLWLWDWSSTNATGHNISIGANCVSNYIRGMFTDTYDTTYGPIDSGTNNVMKNMVLGYDGGGYFLTKAIVSGVLTVDTIHNQYWVNGEGTAPDALTTISGGHYGQIITLHMRTAGDTITVHNGDGNILCGSDRALDTVYDSITLIKCYHSSAGTWWSMISFADNN